MRRLFLAGFSRARRGVHIRGRGRRRGFAGSLLGILALLLELALTFFESVGRCFGHARVCGFWPMTSYTPIKQMLARRAECYIRPHTEEPPMAQGDQRSTKMVRKHKKHNWPP